MQPQTPFGASLIVEGRRERLGRIKAVSRGMCRGRRVLRSARHPGMLGPLTVESTACKFSVNAREGARLCLAHRRRYTLARNGVEVTDGDT